MTQMSNNTKPMEFNPIIHHMVPPSPITRDTTFVTHDDDKDLNEYDNKDDQVSTDEEKDLHDTSNKYVSSNDTDSDSESGEYKCNKKLCTKSDSTTTATVTNNALSQAGSYKKSQATNC